MPELTDEQIADLTAKAEAGTLAAEEARKAADQRVAEEQARLQTSYNEELQRVAKRVEEWQAEQQAAARKPKAENDPFDDSDSADDGRRQAEIDAAIATRMKELAPQFEGLQKGQRATNRALFMQTVGEKEWSRWGEKVETLLSKHPASTQAHPDAYRDALALVKAQNADKLTEYMREDITAEMAARDDGGLASYAAERKRETSEPPSVVGAASGSGRVVAQPESPLTREERVWAERFGMEKPSDYRKWGDESYVPDVLGLNGAKSSKWS